MLPAGTCNLSITVPKDERSILGRAAFAAGQSINAYVRGLIARGMEAESPATAERLREVRRAYYGAGMLAIFLMAICLGEGFEARRAGRRVEEMREECAI